MKYLKDNFWASIVIIAILVTAFAAVTAGTNGNGQASSKVAFVGAENEVFDSETDQEVFNVTISGTNQKAFVISYTSECILFTNTTIKGGAKDKSTDMASVQIYVTVEDSSGNVEYAYPSGITLCERTQTMSGKLNDTEWISLALDTTNANGFNFLYSIDHSDVYTIRVNATVATDDLGDNNPTDAYGAIGDRTLVVEEVHPAKSNPDYYGT